MLISTREVSLAQDRLVAAVADMDDRDLARPSRCRGWTRGHVLSHVARNADAMVNLAHWAMTGEVTPMYEPGRRDPDIAEGATRAAAEIRADLAASNERCIAALGELEGAVATDPTVAEHEVRIGDPEHGPVQPARLLPLMRLQEVVVHHHDLDDGLVPADWPREFVEAALPWVWARMAGRLGEVPTLHATGPDGPTTLDPSGPGVEVRGGPADLLVWLVGRSTATERDRLDVSGGTLPDLPDY